MWRSDHYPIMLLPWTCMSGSRLHLFILLSSEHHFNQSVKVQPAENCMTIVLKLSFPLIITLVLSMFPWWACSSPQAGWAQEKSREVTLLYGLLHDFWGRGESSAALLLSCCMWIGDTFAFTMWPQCAPHQLRKWFGRLDHNLPKCIYTCTFTWSSTIAIQKMHFNARCKGGQGVDLTTTLWVGVHMSYVHVKTNEWFGIKRI